MKSSIYKQNKNCAIIRWTDPKLGFGELTVSWDSTQDKIVIDSEALSVRTTLNILKNLS